jgi:DNA-binding NarL/FixJ family response regulator
MKKRVEQTEKGTLGTATVMELLSNRERQVVAQVTAGSSDKAIAHTLGLSASTVRVFIARALAKAGVRSRKDLVAKVASGAPVGVCPPQTSEPPPASTRVPLQSEQKESSTGM